MEQTRKTKIVATIGPASEDPQVLDDLILAGVSVARVNMSHGSINEHLAKIQAIREASSRCGIEVAILADLPGPKIRAGRFPEGGVAVERGAQWIIVPSDLESRSGEIHVDYPTLLDDVEVGNRIVLGDGAIAFKVLEVTGEHLVAEVVSGGVAQGAPGVHLAVREMSLRTPTPVDLVFADSVCNAGVDYVAVSFVCSASDLDPMIKLVNGRSRIVAKIETNSAMLDLTGIVNKADAIMVARGDLGLDCPIEDVPHLQKKIIAAANAARKPVITATQMLESMITSPSPTRAEVSDVANAVFDGTDALMLSGETAVGADPVNVVDTMSRIAIRAEESRPLPTSDTATRVDDVAVALATAAVSIADSHGADSIICVTEYGNTANAVSAARPAVPVLALSPDHKTVRQMNLLSGISPAFVREFSSTDDMVSAALATAEALGEVHQGDKVVLVAGAGDIIRIITI